MPRSFWTENLAPVGRCLDQYHNVTAAMGAVHGNNLFQSFSQFNLVAGDVATFSGPANIKNILSRVTGGGPSSIDGTIRSDIVGANFFFINPSGVIFGPNAVLDVSGSFAASTANYLKLADGAKFVAALDADDSGLSSAPVSAFGFLGNSSASVSVQQNASSVPLAVADGNTLSLVGGDISINSSGLDSASMPLPSLKAAAGRINLVSVNSAGEVPVDPLSLTPAQFNTAFPVQGQITLQNGALVDASGDGGGRIVIRGGNLMVDSSSIQANTLGVTDGQGIDIAVPGELDLSNGGQITSLSTAGLGAGGNINVTAGSIVLDGGGLVDANGYPSTQISTATGDLFAGGGTAKGGDIVINTGSLQMENSAQISSASFGAGDAGRIDITASSITLDALSTTVVQISANTQQISSGGNAGDIVIHTGSLDINNGAEVVAQSNGSGNAGHIDITSGMVNMVNYGVISAATFGTGDGGSIDLTADSVLVDSSYIQAVTTFIADDPALGKGGNVSINAGSIDVRNGGFITVYTLGSGTSGNIQITADSVDLDSAGSISTTTYATGAGGGIEMTIGNLTLANGSSIGAATYSSGSAGVIGISARGINISSGATITASTYDVGSGGDVQITAGSVDLDSAGSISTTSYGAGAGGGIEMTIGNLTLANGSSIGAAAYSSGSAGVIGINAQTMKISSGATITASTYDVGSGGDVQITADSVDLDSAGSISTTSFGAGPGGNIEIIAGNLTMGSSSTISAAAADGATGPAGTISISANQNISLAGKSSINTSAPGGSGGNIAIDAGSEIQLVDSKITTQAGLDGGNIKVAAGHLVYLFHGTITGAADSTGSGFGNGGNLTIDPSFLILNDSSLISKSSLGNGGNIDVQSDYFFQSSGIIDATAPFGLPGTVTVTAPNVDLSASLVALPSGLLDVETLLQPDCGVRLSGNISSFIVLGGGGLPLAPDGFVPSSVPARANDKK